METVQSYAVLEDRKFILILWSEYESNEML